MSISRRGLIQTMAATSVSTWAGAQAHGNTKAPARRLRNMGVILGSVNKALNENPQATLGHLAKQGFKELEFNGPPKGVTPADFKKMIADAGLVSVAGGAAMYQLKTALPAMIESAHFFGRKYLACYWPWADKGLNKTIEDWKQLGGTLNEIGATLKKEGLSFAYHNHDKEFTPYENQIPYDQVLANTDPSLVTMELDIYWIHKGNQDAVKYITAHPGRFSLFHVKDMGPEPDRATVCVGDGTIPFGKVFAALEGQPGERHFFWEREGHADAKIELACASQTAKMLKGLRF